MKHIILFLAFASMIAWTGCKSPAEQEVKQQVSYEFLDAPDWSKNANIYEVNIRQFTPEGTFQAFKSHLPRLKKLGVDILWFMPIQPISVKNRKGELGSYYSIKDYRGINPNFGSSEDFKEVVELAHELGMKVILDWVPNHTGFDHQWTIDHPDWYTQNENGEIIHPEGTDWTDVADLNYEKPEMRKAMTEAMSYWLTEFDIDGFRCDVAGEVPNDFWATNNEMLFSIKHVFMLAEWDDPSLHEVGFHMTYGWGFHHKLNQIAKGEVSLKEVNSFLREDTTKYGKKAYRMNFITNHDENSWNGTISERMGDAADALAVLAYTIDGMPLIYNGQEAGLDKRLEFFKKDSIDWSDDAKSKFYNKLLSLKHENKALWNGVHGGKYSKVETNNDEKVFCYFREKDDHQVVVALNLSDEVQSFTTVDKLSDTDFYNIFSQNMENPNDWGNASVELEPWGYKVLSFNE